ncbi:cadherin-like domain-containing protein [Pseudoalteromonas rubra]|uniref:Tandem-95 repeat protein n=1 Tax=Pseudoalteromonas rubra TaxID=43658 RepID=A0A0U3IC55_9GAMM|nr:cadherin-like domain-containing protein [Pseudoalteromonas rubra]ALU44695.1 hypothetical protein AT705_18150 [Pseudoalteromonas rubra]
MNVIRIALSLLFIGMCILATPVLSAGLEFPTHMQFMLKNLRENALANTLPMITQDHITLDEDQGSVLDLLSNDLDPDQDPLRIVSVSAKYGQVTLMPDGQIKYEPPAHFSGQDEITYLLYDGRANPVRGLAKITVNSVNDAPVANDDAVTLIANTQVDINVLDNDSDIDGDFLTITQVTAQYGTVRVKNGAIEYRPYAEYDGSDVINYTIQDAANASASAKVLVTVLKENKTAPVITGQKSLVMDEDTSFELDINQITYIDVDSLATDMTFEVADGQHYTLEGLTLKPAQHFNGELSVPVTLFDGKHRSQVYNLKLVVNEINDYPEAGQIIWESVKDEKFALYMRGMMHDPDFNYWPLGRNDPRLEQYKFIFSKNARREDHGGWTNAGGRFVQVPGARTDLYEYTPPANFVGRDYVFFFVYDEQGAPSGRGDIVIDIKNDKGAPVIIRHLDIAKVREDTPFSLSVHDLYIRYKGSHSRNSELTLEVENMPGFYSVDRATGQITIDPLYEEPILNVMVQVTDGATTSNKHRVAVPLQAVNEAPQVSDLDISINGLPDGEIDFRTQLMVDPEANKAPGLLDRFSYQFVTPTGSANNQTSHGQLVRVPGKPHGVFRYVPGPTFRGDTFAFWVTDEQGLQSNKGTVIIRASKPAVPNTPVVQSNGSQVTVNWAKVGGASYYIVSKARYSTEVSETEHRAESNKFESADDENTYSQYRVRACSDDAGCSADSAWSLPSRTLVTTPVAFVRRKNEIEVNWHSAPADQFDVQIKYNDNPWTVPGRFVSDKSSISWPNLESGKRRYRVRGCDDSLANCTQWSAESNTVDIPVWIHKVSVEGSTTTLEWGPVPGTSYYDISIKYNSNDWTVPGRFTAPGGNETGNNQLTWNNVDGGMRAYKIRSCVGEVGNAVCSDWSSPTGVYTTPEMPADTPALKVSSETRTFLDKTESIDWHFASEPSQNFTTTLFVLPPNKLEMIALSSRANNQPGTHRYRFSQPGIYRFFAQACGQVTGVNVCSERWETEHRVEVINQRFVVEYTGTHLRWSQLTGVKQIVIESALCGLGCDVSSATWKPVATLTNGELSLAVTEPKGTAYRVKACFTDGSCTSWTIVRDKAEKLKAPTLYRAN